MLPQYNNPYDNPLHDLNLTRIYCDRRQVGKGWVVELNLSDPTKDDNQGYLVASSTKLSRDATSALFVTATSTRIIPRGEPALTQGPVDAFNDSDWDTTNVGNASAWDSGNTGVINDYTESGPGEFAGAGGDGGSEHGFAGRTSGCFNCGQEGHNKAECTNERVLREFTGTCYTCGQTGHQKSNCPNAPPKVCKNCEQEGHEIVGCTNPRKNKFPDVVAKTPEEAFEALQEAALDGDMLGVKQASHDYASFFDDLKYPQLESLFRHRNFPVYLIAIESEAANRFTHMDLQGNLGKTYLVTYRKSPIPSRVAEHDSWPKSAEENLTRLEDAGHLVDCLLPKCTNCNALGHSRKACTEEKAEIQRVEIVCYNCGKNGHRQRDCTEPRVDKFACRNCGGNGHNSKECPEPLNMDNVECKECSEKGHFARDCPTKPQIPCFNCGQTGHRKADCTNEAVQICRNCDEQGHISKDCPKPRDWSRVTCKNCGEKGHTQVRCNLPIKEDAGEVDNGNGNDNAAYGDNNNFVSGTAGLGSGGGGDDNWASSNTAGNTGGDWENGANAGGW